jgi:phosphate/sulfate permease
MTGTEAGVKWSLFGKIFFAWVLTVPLAGGVAAILTAVFSSVLF